ncbi:MAG TPA: DUF6036 family nucleotidyltransferase [Planctomycetota bacterium]|nr:DUF6036 family nucleotidyltransferase [Planctomycetota bacterium]
MRRPVDARRIEEFLQALGSRFRHPGRIYLVGGTTVVLKGLRAQSVDIDLTYDIDPAHHSEFIKTLRDLKDSMDVNVELVSPADFIPLPEGFESRAVYVGRYGTLEVYHFDPYSTALSKIERGTDKDFDDVRSMIRSGLTGWTKLQECFDRVMRTYGKASLRQDERRFRQNFGVLRAEFKSS